MANSVSARKRIRNAARKHEHNRGVRSSVRTAVVKARRTLEASDLAGAAELIRLATSALDKAAQHGILHARNAARRKSRLMRQAAKVTGALEHPETAQAARAKGTGRARAGTAKTGRGVKAAAGKRAPAKGVAAGKPQTRAARTAVTRSAVTRSRTGEAPTPD